MVGHSELENFEKLEGRSKSWMSPVKAFGDLLLNGIVEGRL